MMKQINKQGVSPNVSRIIANLAKSSFNFGLSMVHCFEIFIQQTRAKQNRQILFPSAIFLPLISIRIQFSF